MGSVRPHPERWGAARWPKLYFGNVFLIPIKPEQDQENHNQDVPGIPPPGGPVRREPLD